MITRLFSMIAILLFSSASCKKELHELSLTKTPYTGNELRIDGYYYSNRTHHDYRYVAVFYRDGVCMHVISPIESQDTLDFIENKILLDKALVTRFVNTPTNIGVFKISGSNIEFETWEAGRDIITFSNFGEILNDSTFLITMQVNNCTGKSYSEELTYQFKQFSPKPDSTNTFIN